MHCANGAYAETEKTSDRATAQTWPGLQCSAPGRHLARISVWTGPQRTPLSALAHSSMPGGLLSRARWCVISRGKLSGPDALFPAEIFFSETSMGSLQTRAPLRRAPNRALVM